jgi:hypothetical protein
VCVVGVDIHKCMCIENEHTHKYKPLHTHTHTHTQTHTYPERRQGGSVVDVDACLVVKEDLCRIAADLARVKHCSED